MATGKSGITFSPRWKEFQATIDPKRIGPRLIRHMGRATENNAIYLKGRIQDTILRGVDPPNAAMTIALKGSSKPLVDTGALAAAIAYDHPIWNFASVGLLRTAPSRRGEHLANIGRILHEGVVIRVTPKMRGLFGVLALYTDPSVATKPTLTGRAAEIAATAPKGFRVYALGPTTNYIRIPGRPFMDKAFNKRTVARVFDTWYRAFVRALAPKGKGTP